MSFETGFLSTSTTSRKVAAKITNVTQSTSQSLSLSNAGSDYTLSSLSASVGDTIVVTFYYTDGESSGKNLIRLKQIGGTSTTATIGGIYTGGTISSIQNSGATNNPTLSGFPNPSSDNTFTISQSTQGLSSAAHEAVIVNGADPGDRYQVGFSFTVTSGTTEIQLQNEDDDDEESYTTQVDFPLSVSSTSGTDYLVTLSAAIEVETGLTTINSSLTGNGVALNSNNPLELNPGDRVGFRKFVYSLQGGVPPSNSASATGFASTHWTNTSSLTLTSSYQYKTIKTGVSLTVTDAINLGITSGNASRSHNTYYRGNAEDPDTSITLGNESIEIATTDTSFTQTISNESGTASTNSTITEYRIKDAGSSHESRTGYGSITVTDVPPNAGFAKNYSVEARVTTANGGNGLFVNCPNSTFSVVATTTAPNNEPSIDDYGVAIYDDQGDIITSFTSGHTVLRKIFTTSSAVALSTTTHTDVDTGLTGITTSNCVIAIDGDTSTNQGTDGSVRIPATFVTGSNGNTHVRIGRVKFSQSVNVEVLQHKGATIGGSSTNHGLVIKNGNDETVIDQSSEVFSVREVIDINPSLSTQALYQNNESFFIYLELTQGRYPAGNGPPIPALRCSSSVILIPPILTGVKHSDGSYKTVIMTFQKPTSLSNYKLAMLVPGSASPEYYGGSASDYGLEINDSSGNTVWRSDYRQAIVNNVIAANQFTTGTNQNGDYDVTTGRDGVLAPLQTVSDFPLALDSRDSSVSLTGLNEMDPANSFVAGALTAMSVEYYAGRYLDAESGTDDYRGGGIHILGLRINSTTSANLSTYRFRGGSSNGTNYGVRNPDSYHPEGHFVIFRIV